MSIHIPYALAAEMDFLGNELELCYLVISLG